MNEKPSPTPSFQETCKALVDGSFLTWGTATQDKALTTISTDTVNLNQTTPLHWAAMNGFLDKVPTAFLKPKYLLKTDWSDFNVYHWAARMGNFHQIPEKSLTRDIIATKDRNEQNVCHNAAVNGYLKLVPEQFLTLEALLELDGMNQNVFFAAAKAKRGPKDKVLRLEQIPNKLLTQEILLSEGPQGYNLLETYITHKLYPPNKEFLNKQLKKLKDKNLNEFFKTKIQKRTEDLKSQKELVSEGWWDIVKLFETEIKNRKIQKVMAKNEGLNLSLTPNHG